MMAISVNNNMDFVYGKNYETNKYEIIGLRLFNVKEEDGTYIAKIDDIEALISGAYKVKKDISEFNSMGS